MYFSIFSLCRFWRLSGCSIVSISIYGLFDRFCMGVLRKILILPTTPSLSNKNSFLQIVCTSFGVLIVFYFHIYMVCLNDSAWVFFGKFQFCLPPLPSTQEKKFSKLSVPVLKFFRLFYCFLIPYMAYLNDYIHGTHFFRTVTDIFWILILVT